MSQPPARTVVREHRFEAEAAAIQSDVWRFDEAIRFVEWLLARDPGAGIQTRKPAIWVAPILLPTGEGTYPNAPASVFYRFDDEKVWLLSVRLDF